MAGHHQSYLRLVFSISSLLLMTSLHQSQAEPEHYHVDVRVFVEPEALQEWKKMSGMTSFKEYSEEITSYFVEMQRIYDSLQTFDTVSITFDVESITLMKDNGYNTQHPLGTVFKNASDGVESYEASIIQSYQDKPYDMAVLFSGHSLHKSLGFSNRDTVCDPQAIAIVQQGKAQDMVLVLAQHTAHILGADHDRDLLQDMPCFWRSGHVMCFNAHLLSPNHYSFSVCSNAFFEESLKVTTTQKEGSRNCLKDNLGKKVFGTRLGTLIPPDVVCQRDYPEGFVPRPGVHADNVCHTHTCVDGRGEQEDTVRSLQGTKCGENKICNRDICEDSMEGDPFLWDECPLGDQPRIGQYLNRTCTDLHPSECPHYMEECCFTCNRRHPAYAMTADEVCRILLSEEYQMSRSPSNRGDKLCYAMKCVKSSDGLHFTRKYVESPDGMACGKDKRCYSGKCLEATYAKPDIRDNCPFGDQNLIGLGYNITCGVHADEDCWTWKNVCCESCFGKI